jgi:hypothetical protein
VLRLKPPPWFNPYGSNPKSPNGYPALCQAQTCARRICKLASRLVRANGTRRRESPATDVREKAGITHDNLPASVWPEPQSLSTGVAHEFPPANWRYEEAAGLLSARGPLASRLHDARRAFGCQGLHQNLPACMAACMPAYAIASAARVPMSVLQGRGMRVRARARNEMRGWLGRLSLCSCKRERRAVWAHGACILLR